MKRFVIVMLLGLCCVQYLIQPHAYAAQMFSDRQTQGQADMRRTLDGESQMVLDAISDGEDLTQSISRILRQTKQQQRGAIAEAVAALTGAAAVMLLCSCAEAFSKTSRISPLILQLAGALGMDGGCLSDACRTDQLVQRDHRTNTNFFQVYAAGHDNGDWTVRFARLCRAGV